MLDDGKARMLFRNSMLFYFSSDIWSSYTSHSYNTHKFQESVYKEAGCKGLVVFSLNQK